MSIFVWWLFTAVLGLGFMPLTGLVFRNFRDRGWIFSKSIGILISSMVFFWLNSMHVLKFVQTNLLIVTVILIALNIVMFFRLNMESVFSDADYILIAVEEVLFLAVYLIWVWIIGFKPEAYGTEKFMDYGFLTSMMRSLWMPFEDMWYSGEPINYYYGGQYVTSWMIKLTGINVGVGYNVMRALIASFSFCAPFSLVWQLMRDRFGRKGKEAPWVSAIIAGWAVAFCGNFHYVIYGIIKPLVYSARGDEYNYWFPDSTRYIGYDPDLPDKTIHEYPAYSTVLGDLHAHYLDILFVVAVTAIAYAYAQKVLASSKTSGKHERLTTQSLLIEILAQPEIILIGFFTGIFRFTNFWDFPIYFVVCGSIVFFMNLWKYKDDLVRFAVVMAGQAAEAFVIGYIACLPFTMNFDQISSEIGLCTTHTVFYQFMVLWGLPIAVFSGFLIMIVLEQIERSKATRAVAGPVGEPGPVLGESPSEGGEGIARKDEIEAAGDISAASDKNPSAGGESILLKDERGQAGENERRVWAGLPTGPDRMLHEDVKAADVKAAKTAVRDKTAEPDRGAKRADRAFSFLTLRKNDSGEEKKRELNSGPMIEDSPDDDRVLFGLHLPDLAVILIGLCALGLILMPEVIYVKDIYGGEHYRANTMFKLTYQAFILFGMMMGYVIERCYLRGRRAGRVFSIVALVLVVFTAGYIFKSINSWFGNVLKSNDRISTDASVFVDESMSTDFDAISWLNNTVTGRPVVLEAPGDSYTDYQRVSVATGLPTVLGWYVHEWLWRNDTDALNARVSDAQTIYTSTDEETVRQLIRKYDIKYIYIGQLERQKYPDLNDALLQSIGQVAYSDGETTYIMKVY